MRGHNSRFAEDDRAVSIAVTHALTVAITTVLVSGLLISTGTLLDSRESLVGEDQLSEVGGDVLSHIYKFDQLNDTGTEATATVQPDYPDRIVDSYSYTIELFADGTVEVRSARLGESVEYEIDTDTPIEPGQVLGQEAEINLCNNPQRITVGGCN